MTPSISIESLLLTFDLPITTRLIPAWRGAFLEMVGWQEDLFHNHGDKEKVHYRYPLIQYRINNGKAAIYAINQGISALQTALTFSDWSISWGETQRKLIIEDKQYLPAQTLQSVSDFKPYIVHKYLALNQQNYLEWQAKKNLHQRVMMLELLLRNHILSSLWGLGWQEKSAIEVRINDIKKVRLLSYHGQKFIAFDLVFETNLDLPIGVAVGKAVSHGFGGLFPKANFKDRPPIAKQHRLKNIVDK